VFDDCNDSRKRMTVVGAEAMRCKEKEKERERG
jgi:hypothetical protein